MSAVSVFLSWFLGHLLSIALLNRRYIALIFLGLLLLIDVYLLKPDTYDMHWYKEYFTSMAMYREPGFDLISKNFMILFHSAEALVWFYFIIYCLLWLALFGLFFEKKGLPIKHGAFLGITALYLAMGSVFFVLTTQNAIRQGIALLIILIAIICWHKKRYFYTVLLILFGVSFHWSAFATFIFLLLVYFVSNSFPSRHYISSNKFRISHLFLTLLSLAIAFLLIVYLGEGTYTTNKDWGDDRSSSWVKACAIGVTFTVSDFILGKFVSTETFKIREFRQSLFFFVIGFSILPEGFARILYIYYLVDLMFIVWAFNQRRRRAKMAGLFLFIIYTFAPNALHILGVSV